MDQNLVILTGRLTQDPQTRHTGTGKAVCNFSIAVGSGFGETKKTTFLNVVAWSSLAENVQKMLTKGDQTTVTGRLETRKYTNKAGAEVTVTEVVAASVGFAEEKKAAAATAKAPVQEPDSDEIPF